MKVINFQVIGPKRSFHLFLYGGLLDLENNPKFLTMAIRKRIQKLDSCLSAYLLTWNFLASRGGQSCQNRQPLYTYVKQVA
jgi:hypothetical protein